MGVMPPLPGQVAKYFKLDFLALGCMRQIAAGNWDGILRSRHMSFGIIGIIVIAVSIGSLFFFDEIVGGAYSQGFFDNTFEKYDSDDSIIDMSDSESDVIVSNNSVDKTTLSS